MQTRRDQLQAYRFQNRRALAALVTGEPNVIEPPMRRLTVTTVSGIMIAILVAVGFALVGFIKPAAGDDWKQSGAIIFDRDTYARYVYIDNVLHPVLNYTSAVLAVGTNQKPHNVMVDSSDLKDAKRGATIGIQGLPDGLPSSSDDLVTSPFAVCSRLQAGSANQLAARVTVQVGDDLGAKRLPGKDAVVVRALGAGSYLLYAGQRLAISPGAVSTALQLDNAASLDVGTAFLDGVPAGPPLRTPTVAHAGEPYRTPIGGRSAVVGQLLDVTADHQFFLVLPDGIAALDPLQTKLLETLRLGAGRQPVTPLPTDESTALALPKSARDWEAVEQQFAGLPQDVPTLSDAASQTAGGTGGVCAVYRKTDSPAFEVAPSILPTDSNADATVTQTPLSRQGLADAVVLDPGKAALVTSNDHSATVFVLADPGRKFPVASTDVLAGFGFADARPVSVSSQLLSLVRKGPPLDPTAARRPVSA